MGRFLCIHGHFYQPPRENPWLETIEQQDSALPFHDWNERITAECYSPNAFSRILDGDGHVLKIVNNYERISFNFGPTLLTWMQEQAPEVYAAIQEADRKSLERFSGHGAAVAQAYNHIILPLANRRDKDTQIQWGLADFEQRFQRQAEGMWLAETAVDTETLELLVDYGLKYTILSPYQAGSMRLRGERKWRDVRGGRIDPKTPYWQKLPSGRRIALFFYDGPISRAIAFERLLARGEDLANRLMGAFNSRSEDDQLVHIATDGETYGHHHRFGDMGLAYALKVIEDHPDVTLTNYGEYLENHRQLPSVQIIENTAWSCAHGVGRWSDDCGCRVGGAELHQRWRAPLRIALDWLRDRLNEGCEEKLQQTFRDPWQTRNDYLQVIMNRDRKLVDTFLGQRMLVPLTDESRTLALKLLEIQRQAMLMFTSCGWFFDELSGIETVQIIQYADRAIQLMQDLGDEFDLENGFESRLADAPSNYERFGDGRQIYRKLVRPYRVDFANVAAHFSASCLFDGYGKRTSVYCYNVERKDFHRVVVGNVRAAWGRLRVVSRITWESHEFQFACLHLGDHNLIGGVSEWAGEKHYELIVSAFKQSLMRADVPLGIRHIHDLFPDEPFTLTTLFRDEQRRILDLVLQSSLERVEAANRHVFQQYGPLMHFLNETDVPIPTTFRAAAEVVLNADLKRALKRMEPVEVQTLISLAETWQAPINSDDLLLTVDATLRSLAEDARQQPNADDTLTSLESAVETVRLLPFNADYARLQNVVYSLLANRPAEDSPLRLLPATRERLENLAQKISLRVTV